jgi:transcriptional regulator with XRE-family HTH domain
MSIGETMLDTTETCFRVKIVSMKPFPEWLQAEMNKRGWSQGELARRAGVSRPAISNILSESRQPQAATCEAIARALGLPAEDVFRRAGILPPEPNSDPITELGTHLLRELPAEERERFVEQMRAVLAWQEAKKRKPRET